MVEWAYFDTSVLVKRYVREGGSGLARKLLRRHRLLSCAIAPLEALSAFSRRRAVGELNERALARSWRACARTASTGSWSNLAPPSSAALKKVVAKAGVRTSDALHIASAAAFQELSGQRVPFITADERQREAARRMGFQVTWVPSV